MIDDVTPSGRRADIAQLSLDHFWGVSAPQLYDNVHPMRDGGNDTFNYWWLAHVVDCRLDAFERTGDPSWLSRAETVFANVVERNGGSLFNDYFDDMLWLALASLRLGQGGGGQRYVDAARRIWEHVVEHGWNDTLGESLAWRKQQLYYKNTPANGPLVILSLRLARTTGDERYRRIAGRAFEWITQTLVDPATGFVEDGINREQDGKIDRQWRFTYNQGLYIGAAVEMARGTGAVQYLDVAARTARQAVAALSDGVAFVDEGDGGDEGLFKGIYFRYLGRLLPYLDGASRVFHEQFVRAATDALWASSYDGTWLRAGNDWRRHETGPVAYSSQLSAIMALELRAAIDGGRLAAGGLS